MIATPGAKGMGRSQEFVRESTRITRLSPGNVTSLIRRFSVAYDSRFSAPTLVRTYVPMFIYLSTSTFFSNIAMDGVGKVDWS